MAAVATAIALLPPLRPPPLFAAVATATALLSLLPLLLRAPPLFAAVAGLLP